MATGPKTPAFLRMRPISTGCSKPSAATRRSTSAATGRSSFGTSGRLRVRSRSRQRPRSRPTTRPVAILFGPENGAVSEKLVYEAASEAHMKHFEQLLVIGFAIEPNARTLVDKIERLVGIPAMYVQATPDLVMGDLLKTMRSSQLFSVTGLPEAGIRKVEPAEQ